MELMSNARDNRVRYTTAQALLDRGFGKPEVVIQNTNADSRGAFEQMLKHITNQIGQMAPCGFHGNK